MAKSYFTVGDQFEGKNLYNIFDEANLAGEYTPRMDVLMAASGLTRNDPLKTGQQFSYDTDPGSGEYQFLVNKFGAPKTEGQYQTDSAQSVIKPAVDTLQSGRQPLQDRYKSLIDSIKGREAQSVKDAEIATAREYGKRGIPLSSGAYDESLRNATNPVRTQYAGIEADTGLAAQNADQNILNAIASLQGQAGFKGMDMDLALKQLAQQQSQFDVTSRQAQSQIEAAKQQGIPTTIITSGGSQKLINTQTGQVIADLGAEKLASGGQSYSTVNQQFNPTEPKPTTKPSSTTSTYSTTSGPKGGLGYNTYTA